MSSASDLGVGNDGFSKVVHQLKFPLRFVLSTRARALLPACVDTHNTATNNTAEHTSCRFRTAAFSASP